MSTPVTRLGSPSEWLPRMVEKLLPWAVTAAISTSTVSSPATDAIGLWPPAGHVTEIGDSGRFRSSAALNQVNATVSLDDQIASLRDAQLEAQLGLRLLRSLASEVGASEVESYFAAVDRVLEDMPASPSAVDVVRFARALRSARVHLVDEVSSFSLWIRLTEALDPDGGPHRVPARFVRWKGAEESEPVRFTKSDSRVRAAVAVFLRDDAYSDSGRG